MPQVMRSRKATSRLEYLGQFFPASTFCTLANIFGVTKSAWVPVKVAPAHWKMSA
jgi:hypothetical protein